MALARWPWSRWPIWAALGAALWLVVLCVATWRRDSLTVDGVRHYWLDDDQMVAMRHARNLVEGHGLVFNPGERVEGYTSFGWALLMAAVHLVVRDDARASLGVAALALVLALSTLALVPRLVRHLRADLGAAAALVVVPLALSRDVAYWTAHGFETPLVMALFTVAALGGLRGDTWAVLPLSLVPLARSDALHLWAALAATWARARCEAGGTKKTLALLAASLAPFVLHVLWRRSFYGAWLPNTYDLKVAGVPGLFGKGVEYAVHFARSYGVVLVAALACAWARRGAVAVLVASSILAPTALVLSTGGDMFDGFRFYAPVLPTLAALAWVGVAEVVSGTATSTVGAAAGSGPGRGRDLGFALVAVAVLGETAVFRPSGLHDENGRPAASLVAALAVRDNTPPSTRIAVLAAGVAPYFSRRPALDLLGKTDRTIARSKAHGTGVLGHDKYDHAAALARHPDLVLFPAGEVEIAAALAAPSMVRGDYVRDLMTTPLFREAYLPNPVPLPVLRAGGQVFVWSGSPELARVAGWRAPVVGP